MLIKQGRSHVSKIGGVRLPFHRRRTRGQGARAPKYSGKIFSGNCDVKFGHFSGKNHVKLGNFVNFLIHIFRAKTSCPLKLTELLRMIPSCTNVQLGLQRSKASKEMNGEGVSPSPAD